MKSTTQFITGLVIGACIAAGSAYGLYLHTESNYRKIAKQEVEESVQTAMIKATRYCSNLSLLANVVDLVDHELQTQPNGILSDATINRIVALSYTFRAQIPTAGDSIIFDPMSPERGQLLLLVSKIKMNAASLQKIMRLTDFSYTLLRDADLSGVDLSNANLENADLKNTNLTSTRMQGANLIQANLWGTNLQHADLSFADLTMADLRWSNLYEAILKSANLTEADVSWSQLRKTNLQDANLKYTEFSGAMLDEADLTCTDMFRTSLKRASMPKTILTDATLTYANVTGANLDEADMTGTEMISIVVDNPQWLDLIQQWNVKGALEIKKTYHILAEHASNQTHYRLERNKN